MGLKVFVDFDGTITRHDVGNALFRRFGGKACDLLVDRYRSGEIGAQTCFQREAEAMGRFSRASVDAFLDSQEIDASFHGLVEFCANEGIALCILSDGLDYYIHRILARHGLGGVPFFANTLSFTEPQDDGSVRAMVEFPHSDAECRECACCKRNLMITRAADEDILCLVGEGFSDRCPARYADVVFAKDALQAYCQEENISYYPYGTFDDVTARLRALAGRPRLRPRRRAAMNRRAAFIRES